MRNETVGRNKRGKVLLYNGNQEGYRAVNGQGTYEANCENCGRSSLHWDREACPMWRKYSRKSSGNSRSVLDVRCLPACSVSMKSSAQKRGITTSRRIF